MRRWSRIIAAFAAVIVATAVFLRYEGSEKTPPPAKRDPLAPRSRSLAPLKDSLASAASLRDPKTTLFGLYDAEVPADFRGLQDSEAAVGVAFPIVAFNVPWGDDQPFPLGPVRHIETLGSVAMISWEPRVANFTSTTINQLPPRGEREYRSLASIARGAYDFHIVSWADDAARYRKPFFLRFAPEMNDPYRFPWGPQNGNRPEDFVAAWRHVWRLFQRANATNVIWIWSPQISVPHFDQYYPGGSFVDWVGAAALNFGTTQPWSRWWSLSELLEKQYPTLASTEKPIVLTELATVDRGGDPRNWYAQAFHLLRHRFDRVRAVILIHRRELPPALNWSIADNDRSAQIVAEEMLRNGIRPMSPE